MNCVIVQATPEDMAWIADLEAQTYGEVAVSMPLLMAWYSTNPNGFSVIKLRDGSRVGHLDFLPLRPSPLAQFVDGNITEEELLSDALYTPRERDAIRQIYLESIIVTPSGDARSQIVRCAIANFVVAVERLCPAHNVDTMYGIAATEEGASFVQRLGGRLVKPGKERKDGLDLYAINFASIRSIVAALQA
jgi:hypothetical protein